MADTLSDPAALFSPGPLSPISSALPSLSPQPPPAMATPHCYIVPPSLAPSLKSLYQPPPEYLGGDPEFTRDDLDAVVAEYPLDAEHNPSHYFVRFKDGLARRISSRTFLPHYSDLVTDYNSRKQQGLLDHFDPASDDVHEYSRMNARVSFDPSNRFTPSPTPSTSGAPLASDSSLTEVDDDKSDDEDYITRASTRKSARLAATMKNVKLVQSKLPFSPMKLRRNPPRRDRSVSHSDDELGGYGQIDSDIEIVGTRRSTRARKAARPNLADEFVDEDELQSDDDSYDDSPRRKSGTQKRPKKKRSAAARPAYGHFRDIDDLDFDPHEDESTSSLRAHRDICEKCHERPTHLLLAKGGRKSKKNQDEFDEDGEDHIQGLGGWVRCLKCPVVAHWRCLARTQRDEITRAAHARDKEQLKAHGEDLGDEPSAADLPARKELNVNQTTEFICGLCMKGGTCMGCLEVALEPDASLVKKELSSVDPGQGDAPDIKMVDKTPPVPHDIALPSRELLFRCFSCKRLAHYQHLPNPDNTPWEDEELASYYQGETGWRCADCASYVYPLDIILAWRPFPPNAVEPTSTQPPDPKAFLPREYLVKWAERSYRRTQWVPHMWLVSTHLSKLKNFLSKGSRVSLLPEPASDGTAMDVDKPDGVDRQPIDFEPNTDIAAEAEPSIEQPISLDPLPDAERHIPPAWKTIDRVLDVRFWNSSLSGTRKNKKQVDRSSVDSQQQLERAYTEGEQPDESLMEELDDWSSRTQKKLSIAQADEVVWAFVKWEDLGYDDATWDSPPRPGEAGYDAYRRAFQSFINAQQISGKKTRKEIDELESRVENGYDKFALKRDLDEQPDLGQSEQLKLMKFQIDGYNWLSDNWWNRQSSILADEMGLGKTVQVVTFIGTLVETFKAFPALVVVPNSTITNWVREFSRWAPRLRVVPFFGEAKARDVIMRYELFHGSTREPKYHVLVTTYETVTNPRDFTAVFKSVGRWEVLVVDEGQRLKSDSSLLFKKLNDIGPIHRVIMTGTPLNNNIRELFNLMNFLDRDNWRDLEALEAEYEELNEELVRQLHVRLKPYFLRRIKSEVLQLPPKNEVIVPLSMSPLQKEVYRSIFSQNLEILQQLTQGSSTNAGRASRPSFKTNMNNILMQLRKCLQHPYLMSNDIEPRGLEPRQAHEKLIDASAKLRLLKSLLPKLKAKGHRVLLFSQFVIALDIVEDFLSGEKYKYLRIDGDTKQATRQKNMDEFNKPNSDIFIFLLTTRAGGVGINLYTADTVIIFDPDFNPHQDLQAIARSHRYGQKKTCLVFKLMIKDSAEERIMQAGKKKLVLDHLIVQKMDDDENGGDDLRSILTFGAKALFEEGDQSSKDIVYTDSDLDKLIEKTEVEGDSGEISSEPGLKFNFAKVWAAGKDTLEDIGDTVPDIDQGDSWAQALGRIAAQKAADDAPEATGRGVRRKVAPAFPQQVLDFLDDESPTRTTVKGKKKGQARKSGTTSDSDAYDGYDGAGEESDASTYSMAMDVDQELLLAPDLPKKQRRSLLPSEAPAIQPEPALLRPVEEECGLCGNTHPTGACEMLGSTSNLLEYRNMLLGNAGEEPWEYRKAAVEAIEQTLYDRGQGHLLINPISQPAPVLPAIKPKVKAHKHKPSKHSTGAPSKVRMHKENGVPPQPMGRHPEGTWASSKSAVASGNPSTTDNPIVLPASLPSKRTSSPNGVPENLSKKQKQNGYSGCSVCLGSQHPIENCPIVCQDIQSITKHILRLSDDLSQERVVEKLRRIVKRRKRENEAGPSQYQDTNAYNALPGP